MPLLSICTFVNTLKDGLLFRKWSCWWAKLENLAWKFVRCQASFANRHTLLTSIPWNTWKNLELNVALFLESNRWWLHVTTCRSSHAHCRVNLFFLIVLEKIPTSNGFVRAETSRANRLHFAKNVTRSSRRSWVLWRLYQEKNLPGSRIHGIIVHGVLVIKWDGVFLVSLLLFPWRCWFQLEGFLEVLGNMKISVRAVFRLCEIAVPE